MMNLNGAEPKILRWISKQSFYEFWYLLCIYGYLSPAFIMALASFLQTKLTGRCIGLLETYTRATNVKSSSGEVSREGV